MSLIRRRLARSSALWASFAVLFVLLLPIAAPVGWMLARLDRRKIAKIARGFVCVSCGATLGAEALRLADEKWSAELAGLHERFPGARFRIVRDLHAVCPGCGREYRYVEESASLVVRTKHRSG